MIFSNIFPRGLRTALTILSAAFLLTGCGDDDKRRDKDKNQDKKSAELRVAILQERFNSMATALDELEQQTKTQQQAINRVRSEMKSIRSSLAKGNLKGYSIDSVSSEPLILKTIQEKRKENKKAEKEEEKREEAQKKVLSTIVMVLFALFLIVIFTMFWRERRNGPDNFSPADYEPYTPEDDVEETPPTNSATADEHDNERPNDLPPSGL